MNTRLKTLLIAGLGSLPLHLADAANWASVADGDWTNASIWEIDNVAAAYSPGSAAHFAAGTTLSDQMNWPAIAHHVTVSTTIPHEVFSFMQVGTSADASLTIQNGGSLDVAGFPLAVGGNGFTSTVIVDSGGSLVLGGQLEVGSWGAGTAATVTVNDGGSLNATAAGGSGNLFLGKNGSVGDFNVYGYAKFWEMYEAPGAGSVITVSGNGMLEFGAFWTEGFVNSTLIPGGFLVAGPGEELNVDVVGEPGSQTLQITATTIPEPASLGLLALGGLALLRRRRS